MLQLPKLPLELNLSSTRFTIDSSHHTLKIIIPSQLLTQISKLSFESTHFIRFKNVRLLELEATLSDFVLVEQNLEEECIPIKLVKNIPNQSQEQSIIESSLFSFKLSMLLNPSKEQLTLCTNNDAIKYHARIVQQIKMANNPKLQSIIQRFQKCNELDYGFLTMDRKKRVMVEELDTPYPKVGMWVYGEELTLESMYVYDLIYKFTTEMIENRWSIEVNKDEKKQNRIKNSRVSKKFEFSFIFQIYKNTKSETYLLSIESIEFQTKKETLCYSKLDEIEFGRNSERPSCMEFTLRDRETTTLKQNTIMNTIDLQSPIKNLKDNHESKSFLEASPQFTKMDQSSIPYVDPNPSKYLTQTNTHLVQRIKTQQDQIQSLKQQMQRMKTHVIKTLSSRTPEKIRFIRSPGCETISSVKKSLRVDQLRQSDLKVWGIVSPSLDQKMNNSKESTKEKNSFEVEQFEKVREFILEDGSSMELKVTSARERLAEVWDHIEIIQEEEG